MAHELYFFTGTGNSLSIARQLADKSAALLVPVTATSKQPEISGDTIGLVFPIYMLNAPRIIYDFIGKIASVNYCYIVMTMGGNSGTTAHKISSMLQSKGLRLGAAFSVLMPENYLAWSGAPAVEEQQKLFAGAKSRIESIAGIIAAKKEHLDNEKQVFGKLPNAWPFPFNIFPQGLRQGFCDVGFKFIDKMDSSFTVTSSCNGCGVCSQLCPVGNISIVNNQPQWHHHCEQCFACIQWCPQAAIEYRKSTIGKKRYHHPDASMKDMVNQAKGIQAALSGK